MPFLASVIGTSVATEGGISCLSSLPSICRLRIRAAAYLEHRQRHRLLAASDADRRHRATVPNPYGIDHFSSRGPRPGTRACSVCGKVPGWCRRSLSRGGSPRQRIADQAAVHDWRGASCTSPLWPCILAAAYLEHRQRHRLLAASDADRRHRATVPNPYGIDHFSSRGPRPAGWCRRSLFRGEG